MDARELFALGCLTVAVAVSAWYSLAVLAGIAYLTWVVSS